MSDALCEKERLTIIKNPKGKTPRSMYFAEKRGEPTKYNLMRLAIDYAVSVSFDETQFINVMKKQGYIVNLDPRLKYATVRSVNDTKNTRLYRLGEQYDRDYIFGRIRENDVCQTGEKYNRYIKSAKQKTVTTKPYMLKGNLNRTKKITGLKALYLYYCYLLGYLPKKNQHKPLSPENRQALRKLDRYARQITLINKENLSTIDDVNFFIGKSKEQIKAVEDERKHIYYKLRRCNDESKKSELLSKRNDYTEALKLLRRDLKTAESIIEDNPEIKRNIKAEQNIKLQRFTVKQKQKTKQFECFR